MKVQQVVSCGYTQRVRTFDAVFALEATYCWKAPRSFKNSAIQKLKSEINRFIGRKKRGERGLHSVSFLEIGYAFADFLYVASNIAPQDARIAINDEIEFLDLPIDGVQGS